jgi:hypothetical protein
VPGTIRPRYAPATTIARSLPGRRPRARSPSFLTRWPDFWSRIAPSANAGAGLRRPALSGSDANDGERGGGSGVERGFEADGAEAREVLHPSYISAKRAVAAGYRAVINKRMSRTEFWNAWESSETAGIFVSGHANPATGAWRAPDRYSSSVIRPEHAKYHTPGMNLRFLILAQCGSGRAQATNTWLSYLGEGAKYVRWGQYNYNSDVIDFLNTENGTFGRWWDLRDSHRGTNPNWEFDDYLNFAK